mgnify:CR=1 FL=1
MNVILRDIRDLVTELKTDADALAEVKVHKDILELDSLLGQFDEKPKVDVQSTEMIYAKFISCLKSFRHLFEKKLDKNALIEFLLEGAKTNVNLGKFSDARDFYEEIVTLADSSQNILDKAEAIKQIGHIYSHQKQWTKARENYQQAIELYEEANETKQVANVYNNLGYNATIKGSFSQAQEYHQKAIQIAQECNCILEIADAHNSLGTIATVDRKSVV